MIVREKHQKIIDEWSSDIRREHLKMLLLLASVGNCSYSTSYLCCCVFPLSASLMLISSISQQLPFIDNYSLCTSEVIIILCCLTAWQVPSALFHTFTQMQWYMADTNIWKTLQSGWLSAGWQFRQQDMRLRESMMRWAVTPSREGLDIWFIEPQDATVLQLLLLPVCILCKKKGASSLHNSWAWW